jgi:uncharacterized membrane protein YfcA
MLHFLLFVLLGLVVGGYGTLIGAGGGFLLVPILIWLYPTAQPELLASVSLAVVFFNALSGSIAYGRLRRIDYRTGLIFSAAALPGAVLGALSTEHVPRQVFDVVVGSFLIIAALFLMLRPNPRTSSSTTGKSGSHNVTITDLFGSTYRFSYNPQIGIGLSFVIGYLSSVLGIGGGIIHVPVLVHLLNFPVHIATATSHFILALVAFSGTATHLATGTLLEGLRDIVPLTIGVIVGAQIGARLSNRLGGPAIIRGLALALLLVGIRTLWHFL